MLQLGLKNFKRFVGHGASAFRRTSSQFAHHGLVEVADSERRHRTKHGTPRAGLQVTKWRYNRTVAVRGGCGGVMPPSVTIRRDCVHHAARAGCLATARRMSAPLRDAHEGTPSFPAQSLHLLHSTPPALPVTQITPAGEITHCPFLVDCENEERNYVYAVTYGGRKKL